jgi:hypothetical protein
MPSWTARADGIAHRRAPGVYLQFSVRDRAAGFQTGRPVFIGRPHAIPSREPNTGVQIHRLSEWADFARTVGEPLEESFLAQAVRGFFENGGEQCVVVTCSVDDWSRFLDDDSRSRASVLSQLGDIDLVCAPDLAKESPERGLALQRQVLAHCDRLGDRFAILDAPRNSTADQAAGRWHELVSPNGALYFPWVLPQRPSSRGMHTTNKDPWVPPCGYIAGVYARTDRRVGVHKAPANELLEGVVDLHVHVNDKEQGVLNSVGVNCVRALPGRGIRVWGARTLSGQAEWRYVNVRRLFITLRRWMESECRDLVFESNVPQVWNRIRDRLNSYCDTLYRKGALKGARPQEAYYVKCDAETNPVADRAVGQVTAEIGLAANRPAEFIVVRVTQEAASGSTEGTSIIRERS